MSSATAQCSVNAVQSAAKCDTEHSSATCCSYVIT